VITTPTAVQIEQDVKQVQYDVRLAAAYRRIEELERQVGELKGTPEKIDLELLTQRMMALEAKTVGDNEPALQAPPAARASEPITSLSRTGTYAPRPPAVRSKLILPDLENQWRMATPSEAKAFSARK
jgi:hypothetical protein